MDAQLRLLPTTEPAGDADTGAPSTRSSPGSPPAVGAPPAVPGWHLDDAARAVGRQGVAAARQALHAARRAAHDDASHAA
ncbi:MAG: hypothetical protein R2726_20650 [Acidimicrobiales bacterium]